MAFPKLIDTDPQLTLDDQFGFDSYVVLSIYSLVTWSLPKEKFEEMSTGQEDDHEHCLSIA